MAMPSNERTLTIEELAEQTQTSVRTIRYYIAENLLPGPGSRGKGAAYTEEHLLRLRLIRRLTERRAPLAEVREVMARVTDDEVRALLAEEDARAQTLRRAMPHVDNSPPAQFSSALPIDAFVGGNSPRTGGPRLWSAIVARGYDATAPPAP